MNYLPLNATNELELGTIQVLRSIVPLNLSRSIRLLGFSSGKQKRGDSVSSPDVISL